MRSRWLKFKTFFEDGMGKRSRDPRDAEIGKRVRAQRLHRGMSQMVLADNLDLTFQQVQKYEKGTNRISAGRLQRIAEVLTVPIMFFYAGFEKLEANATLILSPSISTFFKRMTPCGWYAPIRA